jgi:cell division protein FtsW
VFVPKIGHEINGAKRWIGFGRYSFQPSELTKYLIPIYFIYHFINEGKIEKFTSFLKFLSIFIIPIVLILLEPDNGTVAIILVSLIVLCFLCRIKVTYWVVPLALAVIAGGVVAYNMPHVPGRIKTYLHPELDIRGKGHQPYQAKIATGSGGLLGKGLGESMQKLNYLPEARSDYIAAIFAEEMGFMGMLVLIGLYLTVSFCGFYIAVNSLTKEGFYLATIMTFLISFQSFLNLGVVSGLLPSKGIALPFFSQGGTSLIVNLIAVFLILSVAAEVKVAPILKSRRSNSPRKA